MISTETIAEHLRGQGRVVETVRDEQGTSYLVVRGVTVSTGALTGRTCDVALADCGTQPYVVPPAIHTRPALVAMDMIGPLKTQASPLGPEWQYWSRRFDRAPTPQRVWAHVLTVLGEVS